MTPYFGTRTKDTKWSLFFTKISNFWACPKLYTPSTLNIDLLLWHTHLIVCAVKWITHDLIYDFHFTFQAYTLPHTLNGMFVSLFKFHTWILKQFNFSLCHRTAQLGNLLFFVIPKEILKINSKIADHTFLSNSF